MGFRLNPRAAEDLDEILDYSAAHFPNQTPKLALDLLEAFAMLGRHNTIGTRRDDLLNDCKTWPIGSYIVIFQQAGDDIEILRIAHGRRRLDLLLSET